MTRRADAAYLQDIVEAAEHIAAYLTGLDYEAFSSQPMIQDGVTFRLEVIGEACRGLSNAFRLLHPEVPWEAMIGMRNRLIHGYFDVDVRVVFDTATIDVPELLNVVREWLRHMPGEH